MFEIRACSLILHFLQRTQGTMFEMMFSRICSKLVLLIKAFRNYQFLFWQVTSCQNHADTGFPAIKYSCFILESNLRVCTKNDHYQN